MLFMPAWSFGCAWVIGGLGTCFGFDFGVVVW